MLVTKSVPHMAADVLQGASRCFGDKAGSLFYVRHPAKSWKWLCLAGNQGHATAQFLLAYIYESASEPVQFPDVVQAYVWYSLVVSQNDDPADDAPAAWARDKLDQLAKKMTPEQIAEARCSGLTCS